MNRIIRLAACLGLILSFFISVIPCGPGYVTPLFDVRKTPEFPYRDFAAGNLGIVKPTFTRSVLFVAFRHLNNFGFTPSEQEALMSQWRAEFRNIGPEDADSFEAIKTWIEARKAVVDKDEKPPRIYAERDSGGYDFFPNCAVNAFETATETLKDRVASHGSEDRNVKEWLAGPDAVFSNCSSGAVSPSPVDASMPEWLQKDREYQLAAAAFYSMKYDDAKQRFAKISLDFQSPWQETADYLVARTLIRQSSLGKAAARSQSYLQEAEEHLRRFASVSGKFSDSSEKMLGLVKYRLHPEERVRELAQKLSSIGGNSNLRQDLIDYRWLMDKFERQALNTAEIKELERTLGEKGILSVSDEDLEKLPSADRVLVRRYRELLDPENDRRWDEEPTDPGMLAIRVYAEDYTSNWKFEVPVEATDDEVLEAARTAIGEAFDDKLKKQVIDAKQAAYSNRFPSTGGSNYEGGYYGDRGRSLDVLPDFLRADELTDWVFNYQIPGDEAYLYSLERFKSTSAEHWLMAAITKAGKSSRDAGILLDAAARVPQSSPAYPTVAYNRARLETELGRNSDAVKTLDAALAASATFPVSTVNQFMELRQRFATDADNYFRFAARRAYGFDFSGSLGTVEEIIEEQKKYYDPEYNKDGREAYEREIEERYREERQWQDRVMFDSRTTMAMNYYFPTAGLLSASRSPALPDYLRARFAVAVWTRAALLDDQRTMAEVSGMVAQYRPELAEGLRFIDLAATPAAKRNAALYFLVRNPIMTPFIEDGFGKTDNDPDVWDINDWWCEQYDETYDEDTSQMVPLSSLPRPAFISEADAKQALAEREKLKAIGDAPKYLGRQVLAWAARTPNDRRLPEALYRMYTANGWSKYGCGNDMDVRNEIATLMKRRYPRDEWTMKLIADEAAENQ